MDVTPKSKQPGSMKRRPSGLSKSSRAKLLKSDGTSSESLDRPGISEDKNSPTNEMIASVSEHPCTPVRQVSLQDELSPQYPHMFRIFHDESPEFRVGWDDGISQTVMKKETSHFNLTMQNRTMASQHMRRPLKRFPTPPRLKQQPLTTDVMEYMQWAKSLVEKARKCSGQTPSPSEASAINSALEIGQKNSSCDNSKESASTKEILPDRRSLPVTNSCIKENLELDRKSLPAESNFSNFFDDSASDDIFMRCSQAVEDSLLREKQQTEALSSITVNNNLLNLNKGAGPINLQNKDISKENSASGPFHSRMKPSIIVSNKVLTNTVPSQPAAASFNKVHSSSMKSAGSVSVKYTGSSTSFNQSDITSSVFVKLPDAGKSSLKVAAFSAPKASVIVNQLLDEDDEFLSSVDLHSLSQMNPPKSANIPIQSINVDKNTSSSIRSNVNTNPSSRYSNANAVQGNRSASTPTTSCNINSATFSTNSSNRTTNSVNQVLGNTGKICSQEVIKKKREEAQRRLKSKMIRHSSL